jgi:CAAX protease family protein
MQQELRETGEKKPVLSRYQRLKESQNRRGGGFGRAVIVVAFGFFGFMLVVGLTAALHGFNYWVLGVAVIGLLGALFANEKSRKSGRKRGVGDALKGMAEAWAPDEKGARARRTEAAHKAQLEAGEALKKEPGLAADDSPLTDAEHADATETDFADESPLSHSCFQAVEGVEDTDSQHRSLLFEFCMLGLTMGFIAWLGFDGRQRTLLNGARTAKNIAFMIGLFVLPWALFARVGREYMWERGKRPKPPRVLAAVLAVPIMLALTFGGVVFLVLLGTGAAWNQFLQLYWIVAMLVVTLVATQLSGFTGPQILDALGFFGLERKHIRQALVGYACMMVAVWAAYLLLAPLLSSWGTDGGATRTIVERTRALDPAMKVWGILLIVFLGPLVEEAFFRGLLFGSLRASLGFWPAAIGSTVLFAALHLSVFGFAHLFILGWTSAWLYNRTGNLWPAILLHMINNASAYFLL